MLANLQTARVMRTGWREWIGSFQDCGGRKRGKLSESSPVFNLAIAAAPSESNIEVIIKLSLCPMAGTGQKSRNVRPLWAPCLPGTQNRIGHTCNGSQRQPTAAVASAAQQILVARSVGSRGSMYWSCADGRCWAMLLAHMSPRSHFQEISLPGNFAV